MCYENNSLVTTSDGDPTATAGDSTAVPGYASTFHKVPTATKLPNYTFLRLQAMQDYTFTHKCIQQLISILCKMAVYTCQENCNLQEIQRFTVIILTPIDSKRSMAQNRSLVLQNSKTGRDRKCSPTEHVDVKLQRHLCRLRSPITSGLRRA